MLEDVFRDQWGRVLATLVGLLGDIELAEDAAQEAFALAAERWPRDGEPVNPTGWLITTARNRATDRIRRDRTLARKTEQLGRELRDLPEDTMDDTATLPDERLELIFTCCHPALALEAQVALTLRTLGGLSTEEVAGAFLVPFETMSKRLEPRQAQDPRRGHPVRRAAGARAPRAPRRRAGGDLPRVQRGMGRRTRRSRLGGDPPGPGACDADARRVRGARAPGPDADQRRAPPRALPRR